MIAVQHHRRAALVYRRLTPPAAPVVDLARARRHLRIDPDDVDENELISAAIATATDQCDGRDGTLNRALVSQTWAATAERPSQHVAGCARGFLLDFGPILAVTAVEVLVGGAVVALPSDTWRLVPLAGGLAAVVPSASGRWPAADADPEAWRITFTAGFGATGADVPAPIRSAILLMVSGLFETRHDTRQSNLIDNPTVERLLAPYRRTGV